MDIIIVEDEGITVLFLEDALSELGHNILDSFDNAVEVLEYLKKGTHPKLIFMDINIRGAMDGIRLALKIKESYNSISFVFLTSYKDKLTLEETKAVKPLGYLIKPVIKSNIEAIMMIVESQVSSEIVKEEKDILKINNYKYNTQSKIIFKNKIPIFLSANETKCLEILVKNINSYISTEQLTYKIWGEEKSPSTIRELVFRLRKKLIDLEVKNIPNLGYILINTVDD